MYFGAEHFIGFFTLVPSAQWYSNLVTERERGGGEEGRDRENDVPQLCPIKVKKQSQGQREEIHYVNCSFQQYTSANTCTCSV